MVRATESTSRIFLGAPMTRILIADDHEVVRSGLRLILEAHAGWEVVAEAADGKAAIVKAQDDAADPQAQSPDRGADLQHP